MQPELVIALIGGLVTGVLVIAGLARFVGARPNRYCVLLIATTALTFVVVVVGAYVRLSDAGLGCPDWPGCYGHLDVPKTLDERALAVAQYPGTPVDVAKGWKEMGHRYIAGLLGLLIIAVAVATLRHGRALRQSWALPVAIVAIVIFQGALGRWTVTLVLKPVIVTLHLIGGMTILAFLTWLSARHWSLPIGHRVVSAVAARRLRVLAVVALCLVAAQIVLGGWVSTNYAALACPDLPLCRGALVPRMDWINAFHVRRELGQTADGELLSNEALTAIHWAHRIGAVIVAVFCTFFALRLAREPALRPLAWLLAAALATQFMIGVLNVVFSLPLLLAAAHNAGAAALLMVVVVINFIVSNQAARQTARISPTPAATLATERADDSNSGARSALR